MALRLGGCSGIISTITLLLFVVSGSGQASDSKPPAVDPSRQVERDKMVDDQIIPSGVTDPNVLAAMRRVPRHRFVPDSLSESAYADRPLPIGYGQTISQPSLVALMTEALELCGTEKVLEIGTGSGYQTAVLAELAAKVFTIEILEPLAKQAAHTLRELGYKNVQVRIGDGYHGWPEEAPFEAIIVTAAADHVPPPLLDQLALGGRLIIPLNGFLQELVRYRRTASGYEQSTLTLVRFVPMVHEHRLVAPDKP